MYDIKNRLSSIGKTQVWLVRELRERGIDMQPPRLSSIINGTYTYPKTKSILEQCDKIIAEVESVQCREPIVN